MAYSLGFRVLDYTLFRSNILRDYAHLSLGLCRRVRHRPLGAGRGLFGGARPGDPGRPAGAHQRLQRALKQIEQKYVEPVESDRVVYSAINGMLQTLDPHSSFMDPKAYAQLRERQEGHYYGLGITINVIDGDITVMALFEGSPAYRRASAAATSSRRSTAKTPRAGRASRRCRSCAGRGHARQVSIRRTGYDKLIDVEVVRDEIKFRACPSAFMMDATTGYIQLRDFSETTDRELGARCATSPSRA